MQIFKTTAIRNDGLSNPSPSDNNPPVTGDPEVAQRVDDFLNPEDPASSAADLPQNPFDLLFSGAPAAAATNVDGKPSPNDFSPIPIVTLQDWLMAHPEGRYFLDSFIAKMESVSTNRFTRQRDALQQAIAAGGMTPLEIQSAQKRIDQLNQTIASMKVEVDKAKTMKANFEEAFQHERVTQKDENGDGYVGNPNDKENSFIVSHPKGHPELTVLLDPITLKPAIDPFVDPNYLPALADEENLKFPDSPGSGDNKYDANLQLNGSKHLNGAGGYPNSTFGAQIDITAVEGFWVEVDPKTKEPVLVQDPNGYGMKYKPKALGHITREDGKAMIGQSLPTESEKGRYKFIRATDLNISSEKIEGINGGYVIYSFKDRDGKSIMKIRIEGIDVSGTNFLHSDGSNYVAATSVGIAVNAGVGKHSSRIHPMNVDASSYVSTGRVRMESAGTFYQELGIEGHNKPNGDFANPDSTGTLEEVNYLERRTDTDRAVDAANYTLGGGFLNVHPVELRAHSTPGPDNHATYFATAEGDEINRRFNEEAHDTAIYLPDDPRYNQYKSGLFITGIRGVIKGAKTSNNIIVVPPPDADEVKKYLAFGATQTENDNSAYATYVDGGNERSIVVSHGGDIYAKGVTFFWRDNTTEKEGDIIAVSMNNKTANSNLQGNHAVFVHIEDSNPSEIAIDNGEDVNPLRAANDPTGQNNEGVRDDWYEIPNAANVDFANWEKDTGLSPSEITGSADTIRQTINDAQGKIDKEVVHLDPVAGDAENSKVEYEYGKQFEEWKQTSDSFFSEWEFFRGEQNTTDLGGLA